MGFFLGIVYAILITNNKAKCLKYFSPQMELLKLCLGYRKTFYQTRWVKLFLDNKFSSVRVNFQKMRTAFSKNLYREQENFE
jgi:hypothetical protein